MNGWGPFSKGIGGHQLQDRSVHFIGYFMTTLTTELLFYVMQQHRSDFLSITVRIQRQDINTAVLYLDSYSCSWDQRLPLCHPTMSHTQAQTIWSANGRGWKVTARWNFGMVAKPWVVVKGGRHERMWVFCDSRLPWYSAVLTKQSTYQGTKEKENNIAANNSLVLKQWIWRSAQGPKFQ